MNFIILLALLPLATGQWLRGRRLRQHMPDTVYATCSFQPAEGYNVHGTVYFKQERRGLLEIRMEVEGLDTSDDYTLHGFHIHEFGDLSNGCANVGSHFNPQSVYHGSPGSGMRHVGDLGNVEEDESGRIEMEMVDNRANIIGGYANIIGRAAVLHLKNDDLGEGGTPGSRAGGNAGALMACCVIGRSTGSAWN